MLNYRKIKILNLLFKEEFTDPQKLAIQTNLSIRTLFSEVSQINEELHESGYEITIMIQRGKGYYVSCPIEYTIDLKQLRRHCTEYLNVAVNSRFGDNTRIAWIIRHLLLQEEAVKVEELSDLLNVSATTLNKDLRIVRKTLGNYNLTIETTPYHGMRVVGLEMAIRNCLIDFCDIYSFTEDSIFDEISKVQYEIEDDKILTSRLFIYQICLEERYTLTDVGFTRISNYLMLLPKRLKIFRVTECLFELTESMKNSTEYRLAVKILGGYDNHVEISYLMVLLFCNREHKEVSSDFFMYLIPDGIDTIEDVFVKSKDYLNFDFNLYPEIKDGITKLLIKNLIRKKYNIFEFVVSPKHRERMKKLQASVSFGLFIFQLMDWKNIHDFETYSFYELVFAIYSYVYVYRNEYRQTNIALIGEDNLMFYNSVRNTLDFEHFNVVCHPHPLYELMYLDYSKYDFIFFAKDNYINQIQFPVPVFEYDFSTGNSVTARLWDSILMKRRKLNTISDGFANPFVANLKTTTKNLAKDLIKILFGDRTTMPHKMLEEIIYNLIFNLEAQLEQEFLFARSYVIYVTKAPSKMHYIIDLTNPLKIRDKKISTLHFFFLDLSHGPITIKNGDSEIRRLTTL